MPEPARPLHLKLSEYQVRLSLTGKHPVVSGWKYGTESIVKAISGTNGVVMN